MKAVSGRITLKNTSLATASVFSTVLVTRVEAYLTTRISQFVIQAGAGAGAHVLLFIHHTDCNSLHPKQINVFELTFA